MHPSQRQVLLFLKRMLIMKIMRLLHNYGKRILAEPLRNFIGKFKRVTLRS